MRNYTFNIQTSYNDQVSTIILYTCEFSADTFEGADAFADDVLAS